MMKAELQKDTKEALEAAASAKDAQLKAESVKLKTEKAKHAVMQTIENITKTKQRQRTSSGNNTPKTIPND